MARRTDGGNAEYRALCARFSVPVFHQPWWLDATCSRWTGITIECEAGVAIWPVPLERKLGVHMTRNPALTAYLGPVRLSPEGYSTSLSDALLQALLERHPSLPVWNIAARPGEWRGAHFQAHGLAADTRPTYLLKLAGRTEADLLSGVQSAVRNRIRRAPTQLTIANEPQAADEMFALQSATLERKGARAFHNAEYFSSLVTAAQQRGAGALWTARADGKVVGAQWSLWDDQYCYNMGLARDERRGEKLAPTALLWNAITHAHARGIQVFDFEGSSIPGIAEFFASFGSVRHSYLTLRKNTSPLWRAVRALRP
jgi:CelD/BcsL family acetyltransferase involved in cellulose biosynthesis